jgi:hypothetical protein
MLPNKCQHLVFVMLIWVFYVFQKVRTLTADEIADVLVLVGCFEDGTLLDYEGDLPGLSVSPFADSQQMKRFVDGLAF